MKRLCILLAAACAVACNTTNETNTTAATDTTRTSTETVLADSSLLNGNWQLMPDTINVTGKNIASIQFDVTKKTFGGSTGCNRMSGNFTLKGDTLKFDNRMITTKMACVDYDESKFIQSMLSTNHYIIRNNELFMMSYDKVALRWVRK